MEQQEKKLIENLFHRLAHAEKNSITKDMIANDLIQDLLIKQPNAPYYMAQIILVQETVVNKLNDKISQLEKDMTLMKQAENKKSSSSFLSGLFGSNNLGKKNKENNGSLDVSSKFEDNNQAISNHTMRTISPYTNSNPPMHSGNNIQSTPSNNSSSFLSGALQTATGVAGGMVMANMLTHLFEHKNPGEDIFNHTNNSYLEPDIVVEREIHNHYIHDDNHVDNLSKNVHHNDDNSHDNQQEHYDDNIDIDDDNFI